MNITMVLVASVDGKITAQTSEQSGNSELVEQGPSSWASPEDQQFFATLIDQSELIVMGRKTYEAARPTMQLKPGKLRVVLTQHPEKYTSEEVPGQLEFSSELPPELVERLSKQSTESNHIYEKMLVVGGSDVNWLFLNTKLVNRLFVTIEPKIFGTGKNMLSEALNASLQLIKVDKLNENGTLLLEYEVSF